MEKGKLYLVATPIGNLGDITYRAVEILKMVDIVAAEDTRRTLQLLNYLEISKPLISYYRHNEGVKSDILIEKILEGKNIAIVTDAGTPAISDPGEEVVKRAIEKEIQVIPIPGACALINALICSGMNTKEFSFYGFLPTNKKLRKNKFNEIKKDRKTIIIYEAPHKIKNTVQDILEELGDRNIVLAREITKIHEEFIRCKVSEIIPKLDEIKGEIILLIEGAENNIEDEISEKNMTLEEHYEFYKKQNLDKKEIIKMIAKDRKVKKNEIYMQLIDKK